MSSTPSTPPNPEIPTAAATPQAPLTTIAELKSHVGETVTLRGWLYNLRSSGKLLFPTFRDGSGTVQGIVPKAQVSEETFATLKGLSLESSLVVTGQVREDSRAPSGVELDVTGVTVTQRIPDDSPYPITRKEHGVDFLMEHRHLWLRTPRQAAILRVRATIMRAAAEYFDTHAFIRTDPPVLTPNACEGTSELFEMDYFENEKAYLTQSGQLYLEATAMALGKVYSFGPTFRAEKSKTRRHLTEFWMIEPEVTYLDLDGLMTLAEGFLTHIVRRVLETHRADLTVIGKDIAKLEAVIAPATNAATPYSAVTPSSAATPSSVATASSVATPSSAAFAASPYSAVILSEAKDLSIQPGAATLSQETLTAVTPASPYSAAILSEAKDLGIQPGAATLSQETLTAAPPAYNLAPVPHNPSSQPEATTQPPSRPEAAGRSGETPASPDARAEGTSRHTHAAHHPHTSAPFPRLTYDEAHAMLEAAYKAGKIEHPHTYGDDFGSPDETYISSQFAKPVMVHRYPAAVKAFYMQPDPQDPTKALCVDVLAPEGYGEIIGGSQRVDDYDLLKSRIQAHNLPLSAFQWYLDLRKYGSVPHSGFGMGIERCVAWICGLEHVRETIPFARTLNRIYP